MASELQNSIFSAFDTIIERHIEKLDLDKTVVASIERCENALEGKYRVQYKGGSMVAYTQTKETYAPNVSVYVSIPQNDFSQKKWILGKVSNLEGDRAITEVSAAIEDYQLVGENVISVKKDGPEFPLRSYQMASEEKDIKPEDLPDVKQFDVLSLYVRGQEDNNYLEVNNDKLKQYIEKSNALLLEACFRTDLDSYQRNKASSGAEYGLEFNLIFEDGNGDLESLGKQFTDLAKEIVISQYEEDDSILNLTLFKINEDVATALTEFDDARLEQLLTSTKAVLDSFLEDEEDTQEHNLVEFYAALINDMLAMLISPNSTREDIEAEHQSWFEAKSKTPRDKRIVYSLDSNNMLGNPFLYRMSTEQYNIYPIDCGKFKYIESIIFYCQNFNSKTMDVVEDIFTSDIEVYGLQELSAKNGDYCLKLHFPDGEIFTASEQEELTAIAKFYHKTERLTTGLEYYWFMKDGRVNSAAHADYHIRGGVGWKYLERPTNNYSITLLAEDNTAYDNYYKCIVVYQETMVLKSEFSLQNNANKRIIEIESSLGTKFDFDKGVPTLTCKLLDNIMENEDVAGSYPDGYGNYKYTYNWMRTDESGVVTTLDKSYQEYKDLYDAAVGGDTQSIYKKKMQDMKDVKLDRNILEYPAYKIAANTSATFNCYVYRTDENNNTIAIGSASIALINKAAAVLDKYYIVIENGDQSFQYNEAGVSPCIGRTVEEPVVIKPLSCHLYDHTGTEINNSLYDVVWQYPIDKTLLISPAEGMKENPTIGLIQWYKEQNATFTIADEYNYSCSNNQIRCIVKYDGEEITKDTEFFFGKIGDNGTNGTDVTAKIEPWGERNNLDNAPLTLIVTPNKTEWNSGIAFSENSTPLQLSLYRKNEYIEPLEYKNVKWTMAGGTTKSNRFKASANSTMPYLASITEGTGKYTNCIVKGEAKLTKVDGSNETQTHYAFYPIPIIEFENDAFVSMVSIDKSKTLRHILYNADGRNPLYDTNLGVFFNFSEDNKSAMSVSWKACGGLDDGEMQPAFDLFYDKEYVNNNGVTVAPNVLSQSIDNAPYVYIKPKDVYGGAAQNNYVKAVIYSETTVNETQRTKTKVATAYIPIYMSLNLYGLASLNAWDGNTIEINEDNNYIMAPQIGAGIKNEDNTFTGIVMGKATTYDMEKEQVGLLGYSSGRQSIFLDAETGSAIFGLPETDDRQQNPESNYTEGRIELIPGGTSRIAGWNIGSRNLYNIAKLETTEDVAAKTEDGLLKDINNKITGYDDDYSKRHIMDIGHQREGIMLSAEPAYISIKGRPLTEEDVSAESDKSVEVDESLELQLDPSQRSLFTVFAHKKKLDDNDKPVLDEKGNQVWYREFLSGINDKGQLIANTVQNGAGSGNGGSGFGVGVLGAFEDKNSKRSYLGASFSAGTNVEKLRTFLRMFSPADGIENPENPVYIDGNRWNTSKGDYNEYAKPISLHGSSLALYTTKEEEEITLKETNSKITINPDCGFIGLLDASTDKDGTHTISDKSGSYLKFERDNSSMLHSKNSFNVAIGPYQDETDEAHYPWLLSNFPVPTNDNANTNYVTRLSSGSIANYAFGGKQNNIAEEQSSGHILNYATGSLQLNKANQLTEEATDDDGNVIPATYGIDKTLQINDNNVLLGNIDTLKVAEENRSAWKSGDDNYVIGTSPLVSKITEGFRLQADDDGTTLISKPRVGIYSQNGIDINERSGFGVYIGAGDGSVDEEGHKQDSYLLLKSDVTTGDSVMLSSKHGFLEFNGNARAGLQGNGASNGVYINPGFHTGYGIFNGSVGGNGTHKDRSVYATKDIYSKTNIAGADFNFNSNVSLNDASSQSLKTLLENHTHPFSKTVTVTAGEVRQHVRVSGGGASANGGKIEVYDSSGNTIRTTTFSSNRGTIMVPSDATSVLVTLNAPSTSGVTVSTTSITVTVTGTSKPSKI